MRRVFYASTGRRVAVVTGAGVVFEASSGRVAGYVRDGALFDAAGRWVGADLGDALIDSAGDALAVSAGHALLAGVARAGDPLPALAVAGMKPLADPPRELPKLTGRWSKSRLLDPVS